MSNQIFINMELAHNVFKLAKKFQQLQAERVHVYHLFNEGHKIYLNSAPHYEFERFRQLVHEVTQQFKQISHEVMEIENKLRNEYENIRLADYIKKIQDVEKEKLQITATFQLAKQAAIDMPNEPEREIAVIDCKQRLNQVLDVINEYLEEVRYEVAEL